MEFGNIDDYVTDDSIEEQGVDLSFGKGRFITIRRAGGANKEFETYLSFQMKQHKRDLKAGDEETATRVMYDIYARKVVIGWKGWKDPKGKDIPFTPDNCIALFKSSPEIYKIVLDESQNLNNFRKQELAEVGNE